MTKQKTTEEKPKSFKDKSFRVLAILALAVLAVAGGAHLLAGVSVIIMWPVVVSLVALLVKEIL